MTRLAKHLWRMVMLFALFTAGCTLADKQAVRNSLQQIWMRLDLNRIFENGIAFLKECEMLRLFCSLWER